MSDRYTHGALAALAALSLALAAPAVTRAHDPAEHAQHGQHALPDKAPGKVQIKLPDAVLTDQDGKTVRFKGDVMTDRLVVMNFVYTTCTTVCPVQSALFTDLQQRLGARAGGDVSLISVTVDPLRDTPLRLKEFAARYQAGPGWRFVTGSRQAVDEVLRAFDVYTSNFADHPAAVMVGDPQTGDWTRFFGFPSSDQIMDRLKSLQAARLGAQAATHKH